MTDTKRTTDGAGALSRRDAIMAALAMAAGTLVASKPEVALADSGSPILMAMDNECTGQTQIIRNAPQGGPALSVAALNYSGQSDAQFALFGAVSSSANASSAGVCGLSSLPQQAGVWGQSVVLDGVGVKATAPDGTALLVDGPVKFSRSGRGSISAGHSTATVTVSKDLATNVLVLATLQGSAGSGVYLRYAKRTGTRTFQVVLNKSATTKVYFAWMLLN